MRGRFCQDTGSSRGSARPFLPALLPGHRRILRPLAARQTTTEESPSSQFAAARRTLTSAIDSAAKREDYTTAALLKRELEQINEQDPFYKLNLQLQTSITEQRFQVHGLHACTEPELQRQIHCMNIRGCEYHYRVH